VPTPLQPLERVLWDPDWELQLLVFDEACEEADAVLEALDEVVGDPEAVVEVEVEAEEVAVDVNPRSR